MLWSSLQTMNLILTFSEKEDIGLANHQCEAIELVHQDNQFRETATMQLCMAHIMASLETEVMKFLEEVCGWYDFSREEPNAILMAHGKRQVLATLKTLLNHSAEQIQLIAKQKEQHNG